jgi:hypothetical protein
MEAVAALAVLMAFWSWTIPRIHRQPTSFYCLLFFVTAVSASVIATCLMGFGTSGHPRFAQWRRGLGVVNILVALWFGSVQWICFWESCPGCRRHHFVFETHVFSMVLQHGEGKRWPTAIEQIAADLGVSCSHEREFRQVQQRWIGLCLLVEDAGMRLSDSSVYPPCACEAVRSWLAQDPGLAATFRRRVLEEGDQDYWKSFLSRMYAACPPEQLPEYLRPLPREASPAPDS